MYMIRFYLDISFDDVDKIRIECGVLMDIL